MTARATMTRREALDAVAAGAEAASDLAAKVTVCPHSAAGDARDRVLAAAWVRGFLKARGTIA